MARTNRTQLVIRSDASTRMGSGHLMRCLALGQAWKDASGDVVFITACQSEGLLHRLRDEGFDLHLLSSPYPDRHDWDLTENVLAAHPDAWVVLDGYHFDEAYQQMVKRTGHALLVFDDMALLNHYHADVVLNQNVNSDELHYSCDSDTRLLLGSRYVILRSESTAWRGWRREVADRASRLLVTMGGADPDNYTLVVVEALQLLQVPGLEAIVVIGAANPHGDVVQAAVVRSRVPIRLIQDADNMIELMAWADLAVSAGGTTCWEMLFMGLPSVVLVVAENQEGAMARLESGGFIRSMGWYRDLSASDLARELSRLCYDAYSRARMSSAGQALVDGLGRERVVAELRSNREGGIVAG